MAKPLGYRWPLRLQILIPSVAILGLAVLMTSLASAWVAARRAQGEILRQLDGVSRTLAQSNFPLTISVLERMRELSGADFVVVDTQGASVAATLPAETAVALPAANSVGHSSGYSLLLLSGREYFARCLPIGGRRQVRWAWMLYPESKWREAQWDAVLPPLSIGAVALLSMVAVQFWQTARFADRIGRLREQVATIARGEFHILAASDGGDDELHDLVLAVNDMAGQLQVLNQTVRRTERERLLGQLAGGLAHQLRNALTGARLAVQIHKGRCATEAESLEVALLQLTLTEEQIRALLSLGKQEPLASEACSLDGLLAELQRLLQPACQHRRVHFHGPDLGTDVTVRAVRPALRGAVLNLALNAIEAAGPGGAVGVDVVEADSTVTISVWDNGPGPAEEMKGALFEPFATDKADGVGLGLALAHRVATEQGGTLQWARRDGRTYFTLVLPRQKRTEPEMEPTE